MGKHKGTKTASAKRPQAASRRASWAVEFFQRHRKDDPGQAVPARDFLDACPQQVAARILAVVKAVADAPPPAFSGGGYWEAMHDEMSGFYEVRVDHERRHYRLFCLLERNGADVGLDGPTLVLITGMVKPFRTVFSDDDYRRVRELGEEYQGRVPRNVLP